MRRMQKSTELIVPRMAFIRLVKEIMTNVISKKNRIQFFVLSVFQKAAEIIIIREFNGGFIRVNFF